MKTVVITGSARGLGLCMAKFFREYNFNVMISDLNEENLINAEKKLEEIKSSGLVSYKVCDVSKLSDVEDLMHYAVQKFQKVDIWINNAGVNQPQKAIWELNEKEINTLIDVDLKGTINGSLVAMREMKKIKVVPFITLKDMVVMMLIC